MGQLMKKKTSNRKSPPSKRAAARGHASASSKAKRGPITAGEWDAWANSDPEHVAKMAQLDAQHKEMDSRLRRASRGVLADLRKAGLKLSNIEDLWRFQPEGDAMRVVLKHIKANEEVVLLRVLAQAMDCPGAREFWDEIKGLYCSERRDGLLRDLLANAVVAALTKDRIEDLMRLIEDPHNGSSRVLLLCGLRRFRSPHVEPFLERMSKDPDLCIQIGVMLKRRRQRRP